MDTTSPQGVRLGAKPLKFLLSDAVSQVAYHPTSLGQQQVGAKSHEGPGDAKVCQNQMLWSGLERRFPNSVVCFAITLTLAVEQIAMGGRLGCCSPVDLGRSNQ